MDPVLISCPFENGIRMMQRMGRGITGTREGPPAILNELRRLSANCDIIPSHLDLGMELGPFLINVTAENRDEAEVVRQHNEQTIAAQDLISRHVAKTTQTGQFPLTLGGDHSITYPLVRGICQGRKRSHAISRLGLVYFDAHLDMRPLESHAGVDKIISSGNAIARLIEDPKIPLRGLDVIAIGIHQFGSAEFQRMLDWARQQGATIFFDQQMKQKSIEDQVRLAVEKLVSRCDAVYLSGDIDAVRAEEAPGVSAPAPDGMPAEQWLQMMQDISAQLIEGRCFAGFDLAESSSRRQHWKALYSAELGRHAPQGNQQSYPSSVLLSTARLAAQTVQKIVQKLAAN